jgi:hypothetical protein
MKYIPILLLFSLPCFGQGIDLDRQTETDPIYAADSAKGLHWADTTTQIATQDDILNPDSIHIGGKVNYVTIDSVNGVRYHGATKVWDDLTISALALASGVQAPTNRAIIGGILQQAFNFQTANDIVYGQIQFPHKWVYDDSVEVHLHCAVEAAPGAGDTVVVDFEYAWVDINDVITVSDTIQKKIVVAAWTAKQHKRVDLGWLQGTDLGLSSILIFRVERRRDLTSDSYDSANNWWHLFDVDIHYLIDKDGSNNQTSN